MSSVVIRIARTMAVLGGLVLTFLVLLTCVSVAGRGMGTFAHWNLLENLAPGLATAIAGTGVGPIQGDFELVEAGIAFSVFAFLPLCQLYSGHAAVDVFTSRLPRRANLVLAALWEVILSGLILLVTWRLLFGLVDKFANGETTFILQFPVWWAYAASFAAACSAAAVAVFCAWSRVVEAATGRKLMPERGEAGA